MYQCLVKVCGKGDYKSNDLTRYTAAYMRTQQRFTELIQYCGIDCPDLRLECWTSLYFPKVKVIQSATSQTEAKTLMEAREGTSIVQCKRFGAMNPALKAVLALAVRLAGNEDFPLYIEILNELERDL